MSVTALSLYAHKSPGGTWSEQQVTGWRNEWPDNQVFPVIRRRVGLDGSTHLTVTDVNLAAIRQDVIDYRNGGGT